MLAPWDNIVHEVRYTKCKSLHFKDAKGWGGEGHEWDEALDDNAGDNKNTSRNYHSNSKIK